MDKRYRDYFLVSIDHIDRATTIHNLQQITDIKIHPPYGHKYPPEVVKTGTKWLYQKSHDGYDMMISCRKQATNAVIYELNKTSYRYADSKWEQI